MSEEQVAVYDLAGRATGESVPRSRMRRENLVHGVACTLVRNTAGQVYVHRRTLTKDVFPGFHDCVAAGTIQAGEDPAECAVREAAEELGVSGVPLRPLFGMAYEDEATRSFSFVFETTFDGPIVHQPSEVAWGAWMTPDELLEHLDDPGWPFVPDGRVLVGELLRRGLLGPGRLDPDDLRRGGQ